MHRAATLLPSGCVDERRCADKEAFTCLFGVKAIINDYELHCKFIIFLHESIQLLSVRHLIVLPIKGLNFFKASSAALAVMSLPRRCKGVYGLI